MGGPRPGRFMPGRGGIGWDCMALHGLHGMDVVKYFGRQRHAYNDVQIGKASNS